MPTKLTAIRPKRFNLIDPPRLAANTRRSMKRYLQSVALQMTVYPPNPGVSYQRTRQLSNGWLSESSIRINQDGSEGTLTNPVKWAVYAQGPYGGGRGVGERQTARMRRLGWQSITDVARRTRPLYKELMNRALVGRP